MSELTKEDQSDECIQYAQKLRKAWSLRDYHRFFTLYKSAPKMAGYLIDWFIDRERKIALKIMIKAYEKSISFNFFLLRITRAIQGLTFGLGILSKMSKIDSWECKSGCSFFYFFMNFILVSLTFRY